MWVPFFLGHPVHITLAVYSEEVNDYYYSEEVSVYYFIVTNCLKNKPKCGGLQTVNRFNVLKRAIFSCSHATRTIPSGIVI